MCIIIAYMYKYNTQMRKQQKRNAFRLPLWSSVLVRE